MLQRSLPEPALGLAGYQCGLCAQRFPWEKKEWTKGGADRPRPPDPRCGRAVLRSRLPGDLKGWDLCP